ncbi:uncharacterized protein LOC116420367 [Sarcophilus harrisii]|uniref:uncharacterized protein LOC116420367 n=1 Tax=Sarcophilus harrisii TaxID=9305 RepID=UPI001301A80B|nr:uncharacterized protein LOC116420367 [Sarcophilus harrisii]
MAAFIYIAEGPPPKTAPGHVPGAPELTVLPAYIASDLPRNNPLKQLGKLQQNSRGCDGVLHLHSRGVLFQRHLQDIVSLREMDWKTWEIFSRTEGAVENPQLHSRASSSKTAPGQGLPQRNGLENLVKIQGNRGCHGGLHLHSRGSSSQDAPGHEGVAAFFSCTALGSLPKTAPGHEGTLAAFICTAGGPPPKTTPGHGLPQTNSLENLGNIQQNRMQWRPSAAQQGTFLQRQLQDMASDFWVALEAAPS